MKTKIFHKLSIPQYLCIGFALVILTGGLLLSLPISSRSGEWTPFIDALFTATSATCVTGQIIYNTAAHWNLFGQIVIITLIEIGGLGVMTLLVLLTLFLGKKLQLRDRLKIHDALNLKESIDASTIVKYILKFALTVQVLGALILSTQLIPQFGLLKGMYFSLFHAISAFCNAGFDVFGDSVISYQNNPIILLTIAFLIIFGGLGFIVWRDLLNYRKNKRLMLQTKLTLIMTTLLLVGGTLYFMMSEANRSTFMHLSPLHYVFNTFFMSATARTAGYVNIDYATLSLASLFMTCILMFIGGAPGSTAGGLKVTTLATLVLYVKASIKNEDTTFAKRSISPMIIKKAATLFIISVSMIIGVSLILLITETIPPNHGIEYIFVEVFSCFATVGLTMGLTPHLTLIGKVLLIGLMFMGRVGLLTVILSFSNRNKRDDIHYPEGHILIG